MESWQNAHFKVTCSEELHNLPQMTSPRKLDRVYMGHRTVSLWSVQDKVLKCHVKEVVIQVGPE